VPEGIVDVYNDSSPPVSRSFHRHLLSSEIRTGTRPLPSIKVGRLSSHPIQLAINIFFDIFLDFK
jgi:hypothetical protein